MSTRLAREYGLLGSSTLSGSLSRLSADSTIMATAKKGLTNGDSIHLAYDPSGYRNFIAIGLNSPWFWNGGTIAIDPGVTLVAAQGGGGPLMSTDYTGCHLTVGSGSNPSSWTGDKAGKFAVMINPLLTNATAHTQFMAFSSAASWLVEHAYIQGNNDHAGTLGCPTTNCMSTAAFTYPGTSTTPPDDITLTCITYALAPYGYGATQVQAGTRLRFFHLLCRGGKALRIEQDAGGTNHINGLTAQYIMGVHGSRGGAVAINPHQGSLANAMITDVTSDQCEEAIAIVDGTITNVTIDGVAVNGGQNAQLVTCGPPQCTNTCWKTGLSKVPVLGSSSGVSVTNVAVNGSFSGGNQGHGSSTYATRFGRGFPC